jgi:hypothetical protein
MARLASIVSMLAVLLASGSAVAQDTRPGSTQRLQLLQVELTNTIQARKAKVGDVVRARTVTVLILSGQNVIPVGTRIAGHVSRLDYSSSQTGLTKLAVSFDQFDLKHGHTLPTKFVIQAAVFSPSAGPQPAPDGNKVVEPAWLATQKEPRSANTVNTSVRPPQQPDSQEQVSDADKAGGPGDLRALPAGTLIGMPGVTLHVDEESGGATFESTNRKLELQSGLQFTVRVEPQSVPSKEE